MMRQAILSEAEILRLLNDTVAAAPLSRYDSAALLLEPRDDGYTQMMAHLVETGVFVVAEAASHANAPDAPADLAEKLFRAGWLAPEEKGGNYKRTFQPEEGLEPVATVMRAALLVYGARDGDAIRYEIIYVP